MKIYQVFVDGNEAGIIEARNHNEAERKARQRHPYANMVTVAYTET